jgi:hypothetical protein
MNPSSGSAEPLFAAARHALRQSSNWTGVASATDAIKFFTGLKPICYLQFGSLQFNSEKP